MYKGGLCKKTLPGTAAAAAAAPASAARSGATPPAPGSAIIGSTEQTLLFFQDF